MLAGRNDVDGVSKYVSRMRDYSDDGATFHGAYGHRWRMHFGADQLVPIAETLRDDSTDRRCVLQMWDNAVDLDWGGKDVPCNLMATFQKDHNGNLNMTVFCRSNDIIWGCYGANAVHFSFLLEYMANWIGAPMGIYTQVSVNWHAYEDLFRTLDVIRPDATNYVYDPYSMQSVTSLPMTGEIGFVDKHIRMLLKAADTHTFDTPPLGVLHNSWISMMWHMLYAHDVYRRTELGEKRYEEALTVLASFEASIRTPRTVHRVDWIVAAEEWIRRRHETWKLTKHANQGYFRP
jgi:hypothetical protein